MRLTKFLILSVAAAASAAPLLSGCGGSGGGSSSTSSAVAVIAARNPVLVNYSTTVTAVFTPYTSAVRFGSRVDFIAAAPLVVTTGPSTTKAGGVATGNVASAAPGSFSVTASSAGYVGNTSVTFIEQPAEAEVLISADRQMNRLSGIQLTLGNTFAATFAEMTTVAAIPSGGSFIHDENATSSSTRATWGYFNNDAVTLAQGVTVPPLSPVLMLRFAGLVNVPNFTLSSIIFTDADGRTITAPGVVTVRYYDGARRLLYQTP